MTSDAVADALDNLRWLTECRCSEAWTGRRLHAPDCYSDYRVDVETLARALGTTG